MNEIQKEKYLYYLEKAGNAKHTNLNSKQIEQLFILMRDDFKDNILSFDYLSNLSNYLRKQIDILTYNKQEHEYSNLNKILEYAGDLNYLARRPNKILIGYLKAILAYPNYLNKSIDEVINEFTEAYPKLTIDEDLTPENAFSKGYEWTSDVMYDLEAPEGTQDNIVDLIKIQGYKLGTPVTRMANYNHQGLYAPIKNSNK